MKRLFYSATKVAVDSSVEQPTSNFTFVIKIKACICVERVINYQRFHRFAITIGVALLEYKE
jgi:hypothetical protein